jgi:hypothetical protein
VPALAANVTVTPERAVPVELVTTAVIVADPPVTSVAVVVLTATADGVPVAVVVPVQVLVLEVVVVLLPPFSAPQPLSPPQPAKASVNPNRAISAASLRMFLT